MNNKDEFDRVADTYTSLHTANIAASGEAPEYFAKYKIIDISRKYFENPTKCDLNPTILDFGAGIGNSVKFMKQAFPNSRLVCADVSQKSLNVAKHNHQASAEYLLLDESNVQLPERTFDIVFVSCVFHHIPHDQHIELMRKMRHSLKPNGQIFIFEHNPWNPLTRRAVNTCEFDRDAHLITGTQLQSRLQVAGFMNPQIYYRIFFPNALRGLRIAEKFLTWLPLGAQYYAWAVKT